MYENYSIFKENNLFGLKNDAGEVVIQPTYREMYPFSCGLSLVRDIDYRYSYITHHNMPIIPFGIYDWCDPMFVDGFARVIKNKKWGLINIVGVQVIPIGYDNIWPLKAEFIHAVHVVMNGKHGKIDPVRLINTPNSLAGLEYVETVPLSDFREAFGLGLIDVKQNPTSGITYAYIPGVRIEVPYIPKDPHISFVKNQLNKEFLLLHEGGDTGKTYFNSETVCSVSQSNEYSMDSEDIYKDTGYLDDLIEDAFEGDLDNYWNID